MLKNLHDLPSYITITFLLTVALTLILFLIAGKNKIVPALIILLWMALNGILAYKGFFENTTATPPRLMIVMAPGFVFTLLLALAPFGKSFRDDLDLKMLTLFHIVRIPVEIVLYWLAAYKWIPELMTFEGRNFDIISGITAPAMYLICFRKNELRNKRTLLIWNFVCLALLLNIVVNAILSAPFPFQQFAFDRPNLAVLYFPFIWLPTIIVLLVLLSHLVAIKRLLGKTESNQQKIK
jgi:glycerol-3-phosphate acyltransferase PlsY